MLDYLNSISFSGNLNISYKPTPCFKDRNGQTYHNIIFIKTSILREFTHILGLMLSSDLVSIERFIGYVRMPGTMLEGFYDLGPESFEIKYNCGPNCINFQYKQNIHFGRE